VNLPQPSNSLPNVTPNKTSGSSPAVVRHIKLTYQKDQEIHAAQPEEPRPTHSLISTLELPIPPQSLSTDKEQPPPPVVYESKQLLSIMEHQPSKLRPPLPFSALLRKNMNFSNVSFSRLVLKEIIVYYEAKMIPVTHLEPDTPGWSIFVDFEREFIFLQPRAWPIYDSAVQFVLIKNRARLECDSQGFYKVPVHLGLNAIEIFMFIHGTMSHDTYCIFVSKM
jgi:hypothetical protein